MPVSVIEARTVEDTNLKDRRRNESGLGVRSAEGVAGFIGYGYTMGARAVEHLRLVMAALQVATVRPQVGLSLFADFERFTQFKPAAIQEKSLNGMLDHVIAWSSAMRRLRCKGYRP